MPKSKRSKLVSLTQTQKKGRVAKDSMMEDIRSALDEFSYVYVFSVDNMRNAHLKDVRSDWETSRFFMGKNRVMSIALGNTRETEQHKNLHEIALRLTGQVGLFMTNSKPTEVQDYFDTFVKTEYARSGFIPSDEIVVPEGQVMAGLEPMVHTLEPTLRKLGMTTALKNGKVMNLRSYTVATPGQALTPEQAQILKLLMMPIAEFKVELLGYWHAGKVTTLVEPTAEELAARQKAKQANRVRPAKAPKDEDAMEDDDEEEDEEDEEDDE